MDDIDDTTIKISVIAILLSALIIIALVYSGGCVTPAKNIYHNVVDIPTPEPTPTPTPTPEPTPTPTPTPEPTPDWSQCSQSDRCYPLRDYHFWFRHNANNFGEDLRSFITVYGYRYLDSYHWHSVSWGSRAFFLQKPEAGMKYLFVYINLYGDDTNGAQDARQYGYPAHHFRVQVKDKLYSADETLDPVIWIRELQDDWDYAHVQAVQPWEWKIIQDLRTGIYRAEYQDILYSGRSNAHDGYLVFQVPADSTPAQTKVLGSFDNLGGRAMWQLK